MGEGSNEARQMRRQHIFIVNSSPPILDLLRELFQGERYSVTTTNFLPETFAQIAGARPDLLMVDLEVGEQAGWDLLDQLHAEATTQVLPVIVFSTNPALLVRAQQLAVGESTRRFLAKPFDLDVLLGLVEELIGPA